MVTLAAVTTGGWLSTVAFSSSVTFPVFPASSVAVTVTFLLARSMLPDVMVYDAVQVPVPPSEAASTPPPNSLKSISTEAISPLLSPVPVLSQVAVTWSPTIYSPPVPPAPLMVTLAAVTTGGWLSRVASVLSLTVVLLDASSVAVTLTLILVASMLPDVMVYDAVQVPVPPSEAASTPPPNSLKSISTEAISPLLSPPEVLFQVAVISSSLINIPPVPDAPDKLILAAETTGDWLSRVALSSSVVADELPALSVAVTTTFRLVASMDPSAIV